MQHQYTVEDPSQRAETPDAGPTFDLEDGEAACIVLGNALDVDSVLTDGSGETNFALVPLGLRSLRPSQRRGSPRGPQFP